MVEVNLKNNLGFQWFSDGEISVRGFLYDENNNYYESEEFLQFLNIRLQNNENLINILQNTDGCYAIVINTKDHCIIASDRLRSFPLFYTKASDRLMISDNIVNHQQLSDESKIYEFLFAGYTIGNTTLVKDLFQVEPSQIITFDKHNRFSKTVEKYFVHTRSDENALTKEQIFRKLEEVTTAFTKRLIQSANGKTLVIPLSGGYDSRYIVTSLKQQGYNNVICYSYGAEHSFELDISKKVANKLGYQYYSVYYDNDKWRSLFSNQRFNQYIDLSFNYSSLPHIQDFICLQELTEKGLLPKDSIIVPGFCGDVLGGSYLPKELTLNKNVNKILKKGHIEYIYDRFFNGLNIDIEPSKVLKNKIIRDIANHVNSTNVHDIDGFISENEAFLTEHRLSKFIINSLRVYEFFGFEWRMPLWDKELMECWYAVPNKFRINNQLYNDFMFSYLFKKYEVDFYKKKSVIRSKKAILLRKFVPMFINNFFKKQYYRYFKPKKSDVNNFDTIAFYISEKIEADSLPLTKYNNVNGVFAHFLVNKYFKYIIKRN